MVDYFAAGAMGGAGKGFLESQENDRANIKTQLDVGYFGLAENQDKRAQGYLDIAKADLGIRQGDAQIRREEADRESEKFDWKREDRQWQIGMRDGVQQAAQAGGFSGVVDFLQGTDPERALLLQQKKSELDTSILQNETMKNLQPLQQQKALFESYGALGKMATGIMNAPAEARGGMYETALPMIRAVWPDAPDKLNKQAVEMAQLAIAQATPENQLFTMNKQSSQAEDFIQATQSRIQQMNAKGLNSDNNEEVRKLNADLMAAQRANGQNAKDIMDTQIKLNNQNRQIQNSRIQNTETFNKTLYSQSKSFNTFMGNYQLAKPMIDTIQQKGAKDPSSRYAGNSLARQFAKMFNSGALSETDVQVGFIARGYEELAKKIQENKEGKVVPLNTDEIEGIKGAWDAIASGAVAAQEATERNFKQSLSQYGNSVDSSAVRFPSQQYYNFVGAKDAAQNNMQIQQKAAEQYGLQGFPPEMQQQAIEAIQQGRDPKAVKDMALKMLQQQQGQ